MKSNNQNFKPITCCLKLQTVEHGTTTKLRLASQTVCTQHNMTTILFSFECKYSKYFIILHFFYAQKYYSAKKNKISK